MLSARHISAYESFINLKDQMSYHYCFATDYQGYEDFANRIQSTRFNVTRKKQSLLPRETRRANDL